MHTRLTKETRQSKSARATRSRGREKVESVVAFAEGRGTQHCLQLQLPASDWNISLY